MENICGDTMTLPDTLQGEYYPSVKQHIVKQLDEAFTSEKGAGSQPFLERDDDILPGLVIPMYPYKYSAPCSSWGYIELSKHEKPDVFIILGTTEKENIITTTDTFTTPVDYVRVHHESVAKLKELREDVEEDSQAFIDTHFVQSQLPLLQYTFKHSYAEIKILPLLIPKHKYKQASTMIEELVVDIDIEATVIAPTNLTKYGATYNFLPFTQDILPSIKKLDKEMLSLLSSQRIDTFLEKHHSIVHSLDNPAGLATLYTYTKRHTQHLQKYMTTNDVDGKTKRVVSYASILIK